MSASGQRRIEVTLPQTGLAQLQVSVWYAAPGDHVFEGDRLVEIMAEGVTFAVPAPVTGLLIDRAVFARDCVQPGQVLGAVLADVDYDNSNSESE